MRTVTFSEFSNKEVISISDCRRLGYPVDITFDEECGKIISLCVKECTGLLSSKKTEFTIPWENIKKIGDDIIFVDGCYPAPFPKDDKKKLFFS